MNRRRPLPLLRRFVVLETGDAGELTDQISWTRPHRIEPLSHGANRFFRLSYVPLNESTFGHLSTSVPFEDRLGATDSAYVVLMCVEGGGEHSTGRTRFPLDRTRSAVNSPGQPVQLTTNGYFAALSISLKRSSIVDELQKCMGRPVGAPVEFAPDLDMASLAGSSFRRTTMELCALLDGPAAVPRSSLAVRRLERRMVTHLIDAHHHNYTRLLHRVSGAGPWQVRAAEEFIRAYAELPLSLGDLASVAGVSARTLQHSFQRHRGTSPMDFLRMTRLERIRNELLAANGDTTIAQVATRWGFFHFGRFAAEYRKQVGEAPSETLRRARLRHGK